MAAGYIVRRSETCWIARIEHYSNGRRRYFSKSFNTEGEAKTHLQNQQADKNRGEFVEPSKVMLCTLVEEWLGLVAGNVTERTADGYRGLMDRYVLPTLGSKLVSEIALRDIQNLYADMLAGKHPAVTTKSKRFKKSKESRPVGGRVVRHTHAALRQALQQAVDWNLIVRNPADRLKGKLPKADDVERTRLNREEARRFLSACQDKPHGLIFEFALASGCRPEEYLSIKWRDLNIERNSVLIQRALVRHKGTWRFQTTKTKKSKRTILLPKTLVQKLTAHKRAQGAQRLKVGTDWQSLDLVFCNELGGPLSIPNLTYRYFRPILVAARIPQIRLYDLRHGNATLELLNGVPLKVVSHKLGHSTIRLTADTYQDVLEEMQEEAASKMENLLYATGG